MSYRVIQTREIVYDGDKDVNSADDALDKASRSRSWHTTFLAVDELDDQTMPVGDRLVVRLEDIDDS